MLWAGTLGLIQAISIYLFGSLKPPIFSKHLIKCVCFSASTYPATRTQIEKSKFNGLKVIQLDVDSLLCDMQNCVIEKVVADCILASTEGDFILTPRITSMHCRENIGDLILDIITICAVKKCHQSSFDRLIIIGGDTASALLAELGVNSIRITGKPESGIAFGVILNGKFKNIEIATKGGSVGSFLALEKMRSKVDSTD
jgi:uncharacterized protein YgbK (DUF1537 family)